MPGSLKTIWVSLKPLGDSFALCCPLYPSRLWPIRPWCCFWVSTPPNNLITRCPQPTHMSPTLIWSTCGRVPARYEQTNLLCYVYLSPDLKTEQGELKLSALKHQLTNYIYRKKLLPALTGWLHKENQAWLINLNMLLKLFLWLLKLTDLETTQHCLLWKKENIHTYIVPKYHHKQT